MAFGSGAVVKAGTIQAWGGNTAPDGWLLCDGSAISRTLYADLFAVIGTSYGAGNGSTTFNLPNGKVAIGETAPMAGRYGRDYAPVRISASSNSDINGFFAYFASRTDFGVTHNYAQPEYATGDGIQNIKEGTNYRLSIEFLDIEVNIAAANAASNAIIKY